MAEWPKRVPAGFADFLANPHVQPLADVEYRVGDRCIHDGRAAVVCVKELANSCGDLLIRYVDGNRERMLVSVWDCGVEVEL